jgi:predicted acetyltransferase
MEIRRTPFDGGTKLELVEGDKAVSRLLVVDLRMCIGGVWVRCGGIGDVHTNHDYRMKGCGRRLLEEAVTWMRQQGYHLSALFGIPNFYYRFGYTPGLVESEASIATRQAETATGRYAVRDFTPEDAPVVAELYMQHNARRTGMIARDPQTWRGFRRGASWVERVAAFVATDGEQVVGYALYNIDPWRYAIGEVGYRDRSVFGTLLAEMGRRAVDARVERVSLALPGDEPFLVYCQRYGLEQKLTYPYRASGMVRVVDQSALLALLAPMLEERLTAAGLAGGTLVIETDLGTDRLTLGQGGREWRVRLSQALLAQLVMGYRAVEDALFETDAQADEEAVPVLQALFPQGYPYIYCSDRF